MAGALAAWLWWQPGACAAGEAVWHAFMQDGTAAHGRGDYAAATKQFELALKEAEAFGAEDARLATSLNNLAELYAIQRRYADAEPLYKRSVAIREKALGADHPALAIGLNNLAGLYRLQGRSAEAEPLYKRALAIF